MSTDLPVLRFYSVVNAKLSIKAINPIQVWSGCKTVLDLSLLIVPPITPEIKFLKVELPDDFKWHWKTPHHHHHHHHSDTIFWMFKAEYNVTLKAGIHYSTFALDLQPGEFDASCQKSEAVCRFELTDFIENRIVYDSHRLRFFSFRLWFHHLEDIKHVGYFQPIFKHIKNTTRRTFLHEFVVIGTTLKSGSVWSDQILKH